jgi:hypothetical protein
MVLNKSIMYIYQSGNNKIFKLGKGIKLSKILSPGKSEGIWWTLTQFVG